MEIKRGLERFMREPLLMFLLLKRSGIGSDTFTYGLIMHYMKSLMHKTWKGPDMSTESVLS